MDLIAISIESYIREFNRIIDQRPEPEALGSLPLSAYLKSQEPGAACVEPGAEPPEDGHEGGVIGQTGPAHLDPSAECAAPSSPISTENSESLTPEVLGKEPSPKSYYDYWVEKYQNGPNPNSRQAKFIKLFLEGKSVSEAVREAGYSSVPNGYKILNNYGPKIAELMDQKGLTDEKLLETLEDGLKANKPIVVGHSEVIEYADHAVRHRFLETGLKLKDHLNQKVKVDVNFNLSDRIANARAALRASKEREINASE